jgi:hypothetical protein
VSCEVQLSDQIITCLPFLQYSVFKNINIKLMDPQRFTDNTKSVGIHIWSPAPNTINFGSEGAVIESIKFHENTVV